jgi:hypothetical protein
MMYYHKETDDFEGDLSINQKFIKKKYKIISISELNYPIWKILIFNCNI